VLGNNKSKKMKKQYILFVALIFGVYYNAYSQKSKLKKSDIEYMDKLKVSLNTNQILNAITERRSECELLVSMIKIYNKSSEELVNSYSEVQIAYNNLLDIMISDVENIQSIGDLVNSYLISDFSKKEILRSHLEYANQESALFITDAKSQLEIDGSFLGIMIDIASQFLPGFIQNFTQRAIYAMKSVIVGKIENCRFKDWGDI
jgi:NAD-dependent DNA ligase